MPSDALCAENAPTHKHANVPRGGEETHGTHEAPYLDPSGVRKASRPFIHPRMPIVRGISSATQSKRLVSPSLRLAVNHAVPIR